MPSGMTETQRTVFALVLLTYLCVDFKELTEAFASKVFSPDEAWLRKNVSSGESRFRVVESCSSLKWWACVDLNHGPCAYQAHALTN